MSERAASLGVLDTILARTRSTVEREKARRPLDGRHPDVTGAPSVRPFAAAVARPGEMRVIAEHKRRSPSRGAIREDLEPADVARRYAAGGAAALSVLTDEPFFGGRLGHLSEARAATELPTLRKDFVVDPWQIAEARAAGADAVLLIVAALSDGELRQLLGEARASRSTTARSSSARSLPGRASWESTTATCARSTCRCRHPCRSCRGFPTTWSRSPRAASRAASTCGAFATPASTPASWAST
jgi:Indole-3-glycerol phosphate synthase